MQALNQDLAAGGGPKTKRRGQKQEGGHIFKIQHLMYAATRGPNVKWGDTDFKWGAGRHCSSPLSTALFLCKQTLQRFQRFSSCGY